MHHDALELANGRIALVTKLREGQRATILQLPANSKFGKAGREQEFARTHSGAGGDMIVASERR